VGLVSLIEHLVDKEKPCVGLQVHTHAPPPLFFFQVNEADNALSVIA
jgi:hypothetical protein